MDTIKIKFVIHSGTVTALFPGIVADTQGNILSYQAIGQHGSASKSLLECKAATEDQYKDLLSELTAIYDDCNLTVI